MLEEIKQLADKYYDEMVSWRRYFHSYPELSFKEINTAKTIAKILDEMKITYETGIAGTGIAAVIEGKYPGKTIMIRADMDALPVEEKTRTEFSSKNPGVMHACGHDGHMAQALCAAKILNELKNEIHGKIKFVFQPGEENGGGAPKMIEAGVLENPRVDAAVGCHLWGGQKAGTIGVKSGPMMAAVDTFYVKFIGKGGHGAMPHLTVDPVVMASDFVMRVQTIISRKINPVEPVVITCGSINGGTQHNVIPSEAVVAASVRTLTEDTRNKVKDEINNIAKGIAISYSGHFELDYKCGFPPVINDVKMTDLAIKSCVDIVGENNVTTLPAASMGSEDFAFFSSKVPSVYYFVGIKEDNAAPIMHHHESFFFENRHMKTAAQTLAWIAWSYLNKNYIR